MTNIQYFPAAVRALAAIIQLEPNEKEKNAKLVALCASTFGVLEDAVAVAISDEIVPPINDYLDFPKKTT